jgi:uncharacterized protein YdeI (YjbR/CyaY-like superfamily)
MPYHIYTLFIQKYANFIKMQESSIESFKPASRQQWRKWLQKNHDKKQSVWLILYRKEAEIPTVHWSDAVDEALCFGWIDSQRKSIDKEKFMQRFSIRKPNSTWSKINKQKIKRLTKEGLMTAAGLKVIEAAKRNGSWSVLDDVEELIIPKDLEDAFRKKAGSKKHFVSLSRSKRRAMLLWLALTKRPETRATRVSRIAEHCAKKLTSDLF